MNKQIPWAIQAIIKEELDRLHERQEREEAERAEDKRKYDEVHPRYDIDVRKEARPRPKTGPQPSHVGQVREA